MSGFVRVVGRVVGVVPLLGLFPWAASGSCDPASIAPLVERLGVEADGERWEAEAALGHCGAEALPALARAAADERAWVRQSALRALSRIGPAAAATVPALIGALADSDPLVRESAAEALGRVGPAAAAAIPSLIGAFADQDPYLAGAAAVALARIGAASVPPLAAALADPRESVRWSAAIALGRLGPAAVAATPALVAALADANGAIRGGAAYALGALGPPASAARPALTEALYDREEEVRRAARIALPQIAPGWRAAPPARAELIATVERLVPKLMAEHHVPGVSIALVDEGRVAWSGVFGVSDVASGSPVTRETLFEAASMSKPVFAILALQLVEAGRLDLDRPLAAYGGEPIVPDQPGRGRITARRVLSHTSGLPNWRPGEEEREGPVPLRFEPGSRFGYSGEGVFYLQRVVERIADRPLDLLARAQLFAPLGLEGASFAWSPAVERRLASGHGADGAFLARSKYTHPNAAYTLYITAEEYARILAEVMNAARGDSKVLGERSAREMLRSQITLDARDPIERPATGEGLSVHWGLGWSMNRTAGGEIFHHSGSNRTGFRSFSQFAPSRRTALVILTNGSDGDQLWTRLVAAIGDW